MVDLSASKTLMELAEQLAPREIATWRRLSDVLAGEVEMPPRRSDSLVRRVAAATDRWRTSLMGAYALDGHLLPCAPLPGADGSFLLRLLATPVLTDRQALVVEEAGHRAAGEVKTQWRERFRRRAAQSEAKVLTAIAATLREKGTVVSGVEIVSSPVGQPIRRRRDAVPTDFLVKARIDILAGTLDEGGRQWCDVVVVRNAKADVEAMALQVDCTPPIANEIPPRAPTKSEIVAWMLKRQSDLKANNQPAGRDVLIKLAMEEFNVLEKNVRSAWDGRPGAPKRK